MCGHKERESEKERARDEDREQWLAEIEVTVKNETTAVTNDKRVTGGWIKDNEHRMMKDWRKGQEKRKKAEQRTRNTSCSECVSLTL